MSYIKQIYYGLDVGKFVCALLILFLHSYCHDWGNVGRWLHAVITPVAVPFFFITSGFFFGKGLQRNEPLVYVKKYSLRILKMYVFWSFVTLPVAQMCILARYPDASWFFQMAYNFRLFFLTGSIGIYWYLYSLIICSWIIYWAHIKKKKLLLFLFSICAFLVGVWYNSPYSSGQIWADCIHVIWGSERNFWNVGLLYMLIGYLISQKEGQGNRWIYAIGLAIAIVCKHVEFQYLSIHFFQLPMAVCLFLLLRCLQMNWASAHSLCLRKYSTALYLTHYPILLLFDFYLSRTTFIDYGVICVGSILIYFAVSYLPQRWQHIIYG